MSQGKIGVLQRSHFSDGKRDLDGESNDVHEKQDYDGRLG